MALSAGVLLVFQRELAGAFRANEGTFTAFTSLVGAAVAFQIFDGVQVTVTGTLRGLVAGELSAKVLEEGVHSVARSAT